MFPDIKRALRLAGMRPMPRWSARTIVDLAGKRILLTGASSGIGAVAAEKLAAEGAAVICVARRRDLLADVVNRITAAGGNATFIAADLADLDQVDEVVQAAGPVDILINNAARSIRRPLNCHCLRSQNAPQRYTKRSGASLGSNLNAELRTKCFALPRKGPLKKTS